MRYAKFLLAITVLYFFVRPQSKAVIFNHFYSIKKYSDSTKKDTSKYTLYKELPIKPQSRITFTTSEGTWASVDISPDGKPSFLI